MKETEKKNRRLQNNRFIQKGKQIKNEFSRINYAKLLIYKIKSSIKNLFNDHEMTIYYNLDLNSIYRVRLVYPNLQSQI